MNQERNNFQDNNQNGKIGIDTSMSLELNIPEEKQINKGQTIKQQLNSKTLQQQNEQIRLEKQKQEVQQIDSSYNKQKLSPIQMNNNEQQNKQMNVNVEEEEQIKKRNRNLYNGYNSQEEWEMQKAKVAEIENELMDKPGYKMVDHLISIQELAQKYKTHIDFDDAANSKGLTDTQYKERLQQYGPNSLQPPPSKPEIVKFLLHMFSAFNILLELCSIAAFVSYGIDMTQVANLYVGCVLMFIVISDTTMNYIQERKSNNLMAQFSKMMPSQCVVIRNGQKNKINCLNLVIGDIVKIINGDKIPADIRLISVSGLKTELSALNGESEPVECQLKSANDDAMYSKNIIFNSCLIVEGDAIGVVVKTGNDTFIGSIAKQTTGVANEETTLQKEIKHVIMMVFIIGFIQGLAFFIIGMVKGRTFVDSLCNGFVLVLIANIPQGLPTTVSFTLNLVAKRMVAQKIFVKKLQTLETMGCASVIASDKTGTLTQNKMTVENVWFDAQTFDVKFIYDRREEFLKNEGFQNMFRIQALCNRAFFKEEEGAPEDVQMVPIKQFVNTEQDPLFNNNNFKKQSVRDPFDDQQQFFKESKNELQQSSNNVRGSMRKSIQLNTIKVQSESFMLRNQIKNLDSNDKTKQQELQQQLRKLQSQELQQLAKQEQKIHQRRDKEIIGDAGETALMRYCDQVLDIEEYRENYPKIFEIPFNSKNKWQLSIHQFADRRICVLKGAPDYILLKCSTYQSITGNKQIDSQFQSDFRNAYESFAKEGKRVLGFCYIDLGVNNTVYNNDNAPQNDFIFVGLTSLMDPPKIGVDDAVRRCKIAGIKVFMVTGDHPLTAEAIARKIGIISTQKTREEIARERNMQLEEVEENEAGAAIVYGPDMIKFTEEKWGSIVMKSEIVFARISPQQKVEIVTRFQNNEEIVAVTGDGVNDAIALKKSHIGIAMGDGGSAVAKEASDILFMDDNFNSVLIAIQEGRLLFDNLKKSIAYTMTHLWPELVPLAINFILSMPLGIGALQLLSIDLATELAPAIALCYEKPENNLMSKPPRNIKTDKLFNRQVVSYAYFQASIIECVFCFLSYARVFWIQNITMQQLVGQTDTYFKIGAPKWTMGGQTYTDVQQVALQQNAATTYYVTLVMSQVAHIWANRSRTTSIFTHGFENSTILNGVIIEVMLLCFFVYVPGINQVFQSYSVGYEAWLWWIGSAFCLLFWAEVRKYYARKDENGFFANWINY